MTARYADAMNDARPIVPATIGHGTARLLRLVRVSTVAMLAVLLFTVVLLKVAPLGYQGKVYPGVRIADIAVGGLSEAAALEQVRRRVAGLAEQPVTLSIDGQTLTLHRSDLGITYDVEASVDAAMAYGRGSGITQGFVNGASRDKGGVMIPLSIQFNADQFNAYLDGIQAKLGSGPRDASVTIDGTDVVITPAVDGWDIDRAAVQTALLGQISGLSPVTLTSSRQRQSAAITTKQAVAVKGGIDQALAEPVTLKLGTEEWTIAPEQLAAAVRVQPDSDGVLTATLDSARVDAMVATIAQNVDAEATDAWVQDLGTHQWLVPAKQGRTLRRDDLTRALASAFAHGEHTVELVALPKASHQKSRPKR
ncbi:MAG: peptidoglycan binding domain-containing protein [Thermomicrobiales bacterium]